MTKKVQVELHKILKHYQWKIMTFARWNFISISRTLSEDFIEEFQDKVDWRFISKYQTLSESFIEKFQDKVHWENISYYQKLSESFIEKFQDKVYWYNISRYQTLSESFIEKYQDKLDIKDLLETNKITKQFYNVLTRPISISRFELLDI